MKKLTDWIKDNKLISLLILAAIAWILYMGLKQDGWWNKYPISGKRAPNGISVDYTRINKQTLSALSVCPTGACNYGKGWGCCFE